jgi:hypothetical protein
MTQHAPEEATMTMTMLRTVDVKRAPNHRCHEIAALAAEYIMNATPDAFARRGEQVDETQVERDRMYARGCDARERDRRLYIIDRAARLAQQHLDGDRFTIIQNAVDELAAAETQAQVDA